MHISWKWLATLVDLDGLTPRNVADLLTLSGLEIEGVNPFGIDAALDTVVVAQINTIEQHPDADRLVVCGVDAGPHGLKQIVCGARNMKPGDKVPLAMVGSTLPGDVQIKKSKMRGVVSEGMLCAEDELGIGHNHEGLMILPAALPLGQPVLRALDLGDVVLEVSVTANRPDALCHLGISRDLAALTGRARSWHAMAQGWRAESRGEPFELPQVPWPTLAGVSAGPPVEGLVEVDIQDPEGCPRYAAAVMTEVVVGPSPEWMRQRLMAIGQRPINNIVDVTNYVLHECGQPLHAFDLDKLTGGRLIVRCAAEGELIETLDGQTRELVASDLVIADPDGPVAVAGVMGGARSQVTAATTRIVIECAHFNPTRVRKTARRLALHSDSSHRFERGVDPNGVPWFVRRAVELIAATQADLGGTPAVALGIVDAHPSPRAASELRLPLSSYSALIGADPGAERMAEILDRLDMPARLEGDALAIRVPTFRPDIERPVDAIEEIARIEGFEVLDAALPMGTMGFAHTPKEGAEALNATIVAVEDEQALSRVREGLLGRGLFEAVNYSFVSEALIKGLGFGADDVRGVPIRLRNPLSEDMGVMRTTLMVGLLTNLRHNRAHRVANANLFELGRVYLRGDQPQAPVPKDVGGMRWPTHVEPLTLGVLLADPAAEHHTGQRRWDLHDARALVEAAVAQLARQAVKLAPMPTPPGFLHPYACAGIEVAGRAAGWIGTLHPELLAAWGIEGVVHAIELDVSRVLAHRVDHPRMAPIPRFPAAQRDFALSVPADMPFARVDEAMATFGDPRLVDHRLFDLYTGAQIEQGRKSLAITVTFRDAGETLSDKVLAKLQERLGAHLKRALNAELR